MNDRIRKIREECCDGSNKLFAKTLGVSTQYASNITKPGKNVGDKMLDNLLDKFPAVDPVWLKMGIGTMFRNGMIPAHTAEEEGDVIYVPLLPIHAQGGSLNDFVVSVKDSDCEKIVSPIKGADFAINVSGESMYPEYPSGSQILIKKINERAFIDWGKTYVLDTCNGTVIKRIVPSAREGYVRCVSINPAPEYAPFEVSLDDIYGIYRVLMCMAVK